MKVCFISHSSALRGAERAMVEAIESIRPYGIDSAVFLPARGPLAAVLDNAGVEWKKYLGVPWVTSRPRFGRAAGKTAALLWSALEIALMARRVGCDVVVTNTATIPAGALAATFLRVPHVWHVHEFLPEDFGFSFDYPPRFVGWFMQRFGGSLLFNSEAVRAKWLSFLPRSLPAERTHVIYQSVSAAPLASLKPHRKSQAAPTLLLVGSLVEGKGQMDALLALDRLRRRGRICRLLLVGSGPDRMALETTVRDLGMSPLVTFAGQVDDLTELYRRADIALVCSRTEAFGRVAVEAMLNGLPLITARTGGLNEIVTDGVTALTYNAGDALELTEKIDELLGAPETAARLAERAYTEAVSRFSVERYGQHLHVLFRQVMTDGGEACR